MDWGNPFVLALMGWIAMAAAMALLFAVGKARNNFGIVDVGWAGGMAALAVFFAVFAPGDPLRRAIIGGLAAAWGIRLAWYLLKYRFLGKGEDGRYVDMRESLGSRAETVFFVFFQIQALWAVMFAVPIMVALFAPAEGLRIWDLIGVAIWAVAVGGESIADRQLARFKANPKRMGNTCREGLWRYSRHPNYFFEWLHWFAYIAFSIGSPVWWVSLLGPVVMLVFLFKVTGIPWIEKRALKNKGEEYREYIRTTSVFIPLPPKEKTT